MTGFAILLGGAAVGFGLARWLRLPALPLLLCMGFLLSTVGLLPEPEILEPVLVLGISFLLFAAGVELDVRRVGQYKRVAVFVGTVQFAVLALAGLTAAVAVGFTFFTSLYLATAMAASSTLVVVRLLQQRQQMYEPVGRMLVGVLLLQDLFIIVLAPMLIRLPDGFLTVLTGLGLTMGLIALAYGLQRWVIPTIVLRWELDGESLLLTTLGVLFGFIGLTLVFNLPIITGAFLAGVALSGFPVNGLIREQLGPLNDFFLSIFFTVLGAYIVIPDGRTLFIGVVFILIVVLLTPVVVTLVAEWAGFSARAALESGLLLAQTSELSLVIGLQALTFGRIVQEFFSVIVLITAITMIVTPFLATSRNTWKLLRLHPYRVPEPPAEPPRDHILMLGCGETGLPLLETLFLAGYDVFVVDDDPTVIRNLLESDVPSMRGDGSDLQVLAAAGAGDARIIISMIRRPRDNRALLRRIEDKPVLVRVFTDEDAALVEELGGTPIRYAEAAAGAFLHWLDAFEAAAGPLPQAPEAHAVRADEEGRG